MTPKEMQELDAWLVENVMGWTPPGHPRTEAARIREHLTHNTYDLYWFDSGKWKLRKIDSWYPTTNITQAFEVVEKMDDCLHLRQHGKQGKWCGHFCGLIVDDEHAETPALAICLAAKKAWEAK